MSPQRPKKKTHTHKYATRTTQLLIYLRLAFEIHFELFILKVQVQVHSC